jgi:ribosome-associated protein
VTPLEAIGRAVAAAADRKAREPVVLDVGDLLGITDYFLICSGGSERQIRAIAEAVEEALRAEGMRAVGAEGSPESGWVLLDYGEFVVHVFSEEMRGYYDLERLWKDAPRPELPELAEAPR